MTDACETPMSDHIARFWQLLATEYVRILIDIRRDHNGYTEGGVKYHWDSASFPDDVAKALVAQRAGEDDAARLSASEVACYRWPEDTAEHRAMRAAFCDGAAHIVALPPPQVDSGREEIARAAKEFVDSALRWHEVFDDGRGGNNLTIQQTSDLICKRLALALRSER